MPRAIQDGAHVVRMHVGEVEAHHTASCLEVARTEDRDIANFVQNIEEVAGQRHLMRVDAIATDGVDVVAGGGETDCAGDVGVPASNLCGTVFQVVRSSVTLLIMLPPARKRRHALEQLGTRPQHADAHGSAHLVAAERDEVAVEIACREAHVRHD